MMKKQTGTYREWFVCHDCNDLVLIEPTYMETSKWGYERPFCGECLFNCEFCGEDYVKSMSYKHDECDLNPTSNPSQSTP